MAYPDFMVDDAHLYQGMRHCARLGAIARVHAENGLIILQKQRELLENGVKGPEGHPQSRPEEVCASVLKYRICKLIAAFNHCLLFKHYSHLEN